MSIVTVGMFGTCGTSTWRKAFIERYQKEGIEFFNPQVDDWNEAFAVEEARHLAEDAVILFPITSETYACGSLAESGFSIAQALRLDDRRDVIVMIDQKLDENLDDAVARKESLRARSLVKQHLKKQRLQNVYVVDTLEEMLEVSITLYKIAKEREPLSRFNAHNKVN